MPPKNQKTKEVKSAKKGSKRKRKPSENENVEVSKEKQQNEIKDECENHENQNDGDDGEEDYGKFQKYNKDKLWKLEKIAHHLLPSFNMTKKNYIKDVRVFPLVKVCLPHSVYVNSKFSEDVDFCHRRTIALNSYMHRLRAVKTAYIAAKKKHKNIRKDEKKGIYCKPLIDFAERSEFHPDKYFMQDYDFYYTGGNLCVNNRSSQIAHVAGMHMNTLVLNVQNNIPKVHKLTSVDFKDADENECEIFEVQSSLSYDEYIFLRQKHCVSIQELRSGKLNVVQNFKTKDVPFISFTQDPVNTHHLTMSDLLHRVRVCDIEKGIPIQTLKMMPRNEVTPANNWNMVKGLDSHVYIYSARKKVSIIDTRLPETEWKSNYCEANRENVCFNFCGLARSKFDNLLYVASNHKAYCIDRRYMGKDINRKNSAVACWTHQMSSPPLMMATAYHKDTEYIALQSPINSDLRICENMQFLQETESNTGTTKKARMDLPLEYMYKSLCLPYMPPTIESIFQEARLQGKCIKQGTGICDRVKACITGLNFSDDNSRVYLITATSNGDIFARHMYFSDSDKDVKPDTSTAVEVMRGFEENIFRSVRKTPLEITEIHNLAGITKVFRCPSLSGTHKSEDFDYISKRKHMGRWQKSIQSLSKYKDALAADLISIWDFEIENERDININALNRTEVLDSKVNGWLENTTEIAHSTLLNMTSIPFDVLNASNLNSAVDDTFNEQEQKNNIPKIDVEMSVPVKPKVAKKKPRYVKGF